LIKEFTHGAAIFGNLHIGLEFIERGLPALGNEGQVNLARLVCACGFVCRASVEPLAPAQVGDADLPFGYLGQPTFAVEIAALFQARRPVVNVRPADAPDFLRVCLCHCLCHFCSTFLVLNCHKLSFRDM